MQMDLECKLRFRLRTISSFLVMLGDRCYKISRAVVCRNFDVTQYLD